MACPYCYQPLSRPRREEDDMWERLAEWMREVEKENNENGRDKSEFEINR